MFKLFEDSCYKQIILTISISAITTVIINLVMLFIFKIELQPDTIATIDMPDIINSFIGQNNKKQLTREAADKLVTDFSKKLALSVNQLSIKQNLIILPKQAVLAGSIDVTKRLKQQLLNQQENVDAP